MAGRVEAKSDYEILAVFRAEVLRFMRAEGGRVRTNVRAEMRVRTGNARRRLKLKVGWDLAGPYARIVTTARRVSTGPDGRVTSFRYALAQQQHEHYLQKGLAKTPRR